MGWHAGKSKYTADRFFFEYRSKIQSHDGVSGGARRSSGSDGGSDRAGVPVEVRRFRAER